MSTAVDNPQGPMVIEFDSVYRFGTPVKLQFAAEQKKELTDLLCDFCDVTVKGAKMLALMTDLATGEYDGQPTLKVIAETQSAIHRLLELHERFKSAEDQIRATVATVTEAAA